MLPYPIARLLTLTLLCLTITGCTTSISIKGRLVDSNGQPIERAEIETLPKTDVVLSNANGEFTLERAVTGATKSEIIKIGSYRVVIRKFGYEEIHIQVDLGVGRVDLPKLVMKRRKPSRFRLEEAGPDGDDGESPEFKRKRPQGH